MTFDQLSNRQNDVTFVTPHSSSKEKDERFDKILLIIYLKVVLQNQIKFDNCNYDMSILLRTLDDWTTLAQVNESNQKRSRGRKESLALGPS